jgi:ABC-type multidrug transport system ATPase subunit
MTPLETAGAVRAEDVVRFEDVHMAFSSRWRKPVWALRGLTLGVPRGAVLGLLGPNGAGKTTAIACLLGLLEPQIGAVYIGGRKAGSDGALRAVRCGVLLEDTRLPPFLTVRAALETVCALRNVSTFAAEIERVVTTMGIGDLVSRNVAALSKGQARKVGLAAALIGDPALLVLDEPSAGLDADARVEFDELVRGLRNDRRTMIVASHLLGDVESTCNHIAVVREGRVVLAGRTEDLLAGARKEHANDVYIDASCRSTVESLGIACEPSRYPGLVLLRSSLADDELLATLSLAGMVPRRIEPRVSILSLYLDATGRAGTS